MIKGILAIIGSIFLLKYRERVVRMTGKIGFAEKYLGSGGTYNLMIILSLVFFLYGLAAVTGTLDVILSPLNVLRGTGGGGGAPVAPAGGELGW